MTVRKPRPKAMPKIAPIIKPGDSGKNPPKRLMDNQDTERKGDSTGSNKVCVTFWITPEKRDELRAYAAEHEMSQSRVIVEGLNWRMSQ